MKNLFLLVIAISITTKSISQNQYPPTKAVDSSDTYFGTTLKDPFRWLENAKDPEVDAWLKKQVEYTTKILNRIPGQEALIQEMRATAANSSVSYSVIKKVGKRYFYYKRNPGDFVAKLFYREEQSEIEILLFDPKVYSPEKLINVSSSVSDDGATLLLRISEDGREVCDFRLLDIASKKMYSEVLPHCMFAEFVAGSHDQILYFQLKDYDVHDPENALNPKTLLHKIGIPVKNDKVILDATKYPEILDSVGWCLTKTYPDVPFIFVEKSTSSNYKKIYYAPLSSLGEEHIEWKIFCEFEDELWNLLVDKKDVYCITSRNNPYFNILKTSLANPDLKSGEEIFKGTADWKLAVYGERIKTYKISDHIVLNLSKNELQFKTLLYDTKSWKTTPLNVPLNGNISAKPIAGSKNELRIVNYSWILPNTQYLFNLDTGNFSDGPFHTQNVYPGMENLAFEEVEIPSHDGVLVPLSLIYDKTLLKRDGSNITLVTGYGAFGTTVSPEFKRGLLPFLKRGGIYAIAHVRGGGEKGVYWHLDGKKTKKSNSWKDFNACAEYLINKKITSSEKLRCIGGSAGGILIGRAITERPDLYRVAISKVGVMNILRQIVGPNAQGDFDEYGTVTNEAEFKALVEMDVLQHIKKGTKYPAQLITTGYNDPRVPAFLVSKFAAAMQAANDLKVPTLLYVDFNAGHFGANSADAYFKQLAYEYAFLFWQCSHLDFKLE